jgi:cell division protease FtsH
MIDPNNNNNNDNNNDNNNPFGNNKIFKNPNMKFGLFFLAAIFLIPLIFNLFLTGTGAQKISYTEFRRLVKEGQVSEVVVKGDEIQGTLASDGSSSSSPYLNSGEQNFITYLPSFNDDELLPLLDQNGVRVITKPAETFSLFGLILNFLPIIIFIWIMISMSRTMRSQGKGIFSVGQNQAKLYDKTKQRTGFGEVAGLEGAKEEAFEIVDYLKSPNRYIELGAETPRGILLVGPPGTGKTLIAKAIAGEADVPFYSMSGSDFMEMFVGVGASRVRNLFKDAKAKAPSIIFIDELDSIGRHRGAGLGGGHDEREQTLNQLLSELDGFEKNESTIVIAATNRPDILDPALLRPGRFDRQITIDLPSMKDRIQILKIHAKNKPLDNTVDMEDIAKKTPGFSGADLRNLLNEASILAARRKSKTVSHKDIEESRDKVLMGTERKNLTITAEEKKIIAYHEAGHAVTAAVLPKTDPVFKVTVIPRNRAMGVTQQLPEHEKYVFDQEYLTQRVAVLLGGRAAEELIFHSKSSGAENDLKEATRLVRKMVSDWGMSKTIGLLAVGNNDKNVFLGEEISKRRDFSEATAKDIDDEIKGFLNEAFQQAVTTLEEHKEGMNTIAQRLLEKEEIFGDEILEILGLPKKEAHPEEEKENTDTPQDDQQNDQDKK